MADLADKKKLNRFPMGTVKQAKSTAQRLTRDLLNGRLDRDTYRAACYGLSVLCSLFKIESPECLKIDLTKKDVTAQPPEERQIRLNEILYKTIPFYDRYLEHVKQWEREAHEKIVQEQKNRIKAIVENRQMPGEQETAPEVETPADKQMEIPVKTTDIEAWQPCGIGAKSR